MAYTTINKSTDYFNAQTWAGNDGSDRAMTTSFQPDWVWIKATDGTQDPQIYDAVRGATKDIHSNNDDAEGTTTNGLKSFTSDGFTLGGDAGVNDTSLDYVGWSWKAGNSSGSSNTNGTLTSTVSASTTSGFSIGTYTSDISSSGSKTVGHGLGTTPKVIFTKNLNQGGQRWGVQVPGILSDNYILELNSSSTPSDMSGNGSLTTVNSNVFSVNYADGVGYATGSGNYIFYAFADITGFSKFGSYTGNGTTDGTFVYTGFKPAFVIVKNTSATANWVMTDNQISFNGKGTNDSSVLFPSVNNATSDAYGLQLHSNGFKFAGSDSSSATVNGSGNVYIYMAFAEAPLVGSNNVPATAR